ncbi:hypothetical protein [Microbacterium sp.]|jgi:hypothetical protein|uniref:hypothetical protein n=1 Tax=Microbacterium sp. TaxID=51671 RepID=UPI0037C84796
MTETTDVFMQLLKRELHAFLHVPDADQVVHLARVAFAIDCAPDGLRSSFLGTTCLALAQTAGHALRRGTSLPTGGFFGINTDAATQASPVALQANQMIAAAANQDAALLEDLIIATIPAHGGQAAADLIMCLAGNARRLHQEFCHGQSDVAAESHL